MEPYFDHRTSEQRQKDSELAVAHLGELFPEEIAAGYHWFHDAKPNQVEYYHAIAPRKGFKVISKQGSFEVRNGQIIDRPDLTIILAKKITGEQ